MRASTRIRRERSRAIALTQGLAVVVASVAWLAVTPAVDGAIMGFVNRGVWEAAVGGATGGEDFEGFASDASFDGGVVNLADGMNIGTTDPTFTGDNLVDVLPLVSNESDVNGTNSARILSSYLGTVDHVDILSRPFVSFDAPVSGFGADFVNMNVGAMQNEVEVHGADGLLAVMALPINAAGVPGFWGVAATAGEEITEVRFIRIDDDLFGMDNLAVAASAAVPAPTGLALLAVGGAVAGGRKRRLPA